MTPNYGYFPYLSHIIPHFLGFHKSQILTSIGDRWNPKYWPNLALCCVLCFHTLSTQWKITALIRRLLPNQYLGLTQSQILTQFVDMLCVPCTLNSMTPNIEIFRCCVSKKLKDDITDLGNQCFKTCSWIPLAMFKSLLLNSASLEIRTSAQRLIVHMQVQYWKKLVIHLQFGEST